MISVSFTRDCWEFISQQSRHFGLKLEGYTGRQSHRTAVFSGSPKNISGFIAALKEKPNV